MPELATVVLDQLLRPPVPAIVTGSLGGTLIWAVIGYFFLRSRELVLKTRLVEKNFSAEEIERVIQCRSPRIGNTVPHSAPSRSY